jgi:predicted phosphodiesterase
MVKYETHFIPQNVLLSGYMEVYKGSIFVGKVKAYGMETPPRGDPIVSIAVASDVHVPIDPTAEGYIRYQRTLSWLIDTEGVDFVCVAGDLTNYGQETAAAPEFTAYVNAVGAYRDRVYEVSGNHDAQQTRLNDEIMMSYIGRPLYYTISNQPTSDHNYFNPAMPDSDIIIMFGMSGWMGYTGETFDEGALTWLGDTLTANADKRCVIIEHCPLFNASLRPYPKAPTGDLLGNPGNTATGRRFLEKFTGRKNVLWINGHTHIKWEWQEEAPAANYDNYLCHTLHLPALINGKYYDVSQAKYIADGNYGGVYIIDVYPDCYHARARNMATNTWVPIATYKIMI